jgi:predicted transcriptional regulator
MAETTITVSDGACRKLKELAEQSGRSVAEVLERAVEEYHSRQFWEAVNRGYAELRADPEAWAAEEAERRLWDGTLMDGLDPSERWTEERTPQPPADEGRAP